MVQSGTSTTFASSRISPPEVMPEADQRDPSGSPAATIEPNAISSTIAAPRKPMPSGLDEPCAW